METEDNITQVKGKDGTRFLDNKKGTMSKKYYQTAEIEEEIKEYEDEDVKKPEKKPQEDEKSIVDLLRLPTGMHSRTLACKHKFGCFENTLRGMYRMFWITFAVKTILGNLLLLISPAKLLKSL